MRPSMGVLLAVLVVLPSRAPAQAGPAQAGPARTWAAVYGATDLAGGLGIHQPHAGGRLALPLTDRIDFYPGLETTPGFSCSMAFFEVRVKPIASYGLASAWYVGGGMAVASRTLLSNLLTGVQWPTGRWRPFLERHLFLGGGALQTGLAVPIS